MSSSNGRAMSAGLRAQAAGSSLTFGHDLGNALARAGLRSGLCVPVYLNDERVNGS